MKVQGRQWRSIWPGSDGRTVEIIDQTKLPHAFETRSLGTLEDAAEAIAVMRVRAAPMDCAWHCRMTRPMSAWTKPPPCS